MKIFCDTILNMKVIIFGSNGMLGNYIKSFFLSQNIPTFGITRNHYDLSKFTNESLNKLLCDYMINEDTVIINAAGVIPQASKNYHLIEKEYYKINSIFPITLSNICNKYKAKMIHVTTDCVFSGNKGNYIETDEHDAVDSYGISKSLGELCDCTIIRTSIIGEEKFNKRSLLEWVRSNHGKEINGYLNHLWNGVTCLELSKIIHKIITGNLYWKGVRHIFSPQTVSKYELVSMINEIYDLNITVKQYFTEKKIDKSINTIYDTNNTFKIKNLKDQIKELNSYKNL